MSQTIITKRWYVDNVLTDPTSMKLSSPDGAYGVKRTDTDAVVVADGTSLTKVATGTYTYAFTDPAPGLTYSIWIEVVSGGETHHYEEQRTAASGQISAATTWADELEAVKLELQRRRSGAIDRYTVGGRNAGTDIQRMPIKDLMTYYKFVEAEAAKERASSGSGSRRRIRTQVVRPGEL